MRRFCAKKLADTVLTMEASCHARRDGLKDAVDEGKGGVQETRVKMAELALTPREQSAIPGQRALLEPQQWGVSAQRVSDKEPLAIVEAALVALQIEWRLRSACEGLAILTMASALEARVGVATEEAVEEEKRGGLEEAMEANSYYMRERQQPNCSPMFSNTKRGIEFLHSKLGCPSPPVLLHSRLGQLEPPLLVTELGSPVSLAVSLGQQNEGLQVHRDSKEEEISHPEQRDEHNQQSKQELQKSLFSDNSHQHTQAPAYQERGLADLLLHTQVWLDSWHATSEHHLQHQPGLTQAEQELEQQEQELEELEEQFEQQQQQQQQGGGWEDAQQREAAGPTSEQCPKIAYLDSLHSHVASLPSSDISGLLCVSLCFPLSPALTSCFSSCLSSWYTVQPMGAGVTLGWPGQMEARQMLQRACEQLRHQLIALPVSGYSASQIRHVQVCACSCVIGVFDPYTTGKREQHVGDK